MSEAVLSRASLDRERKLIGVLWRRRSDARRRLLRALEDAFPVGFEDRRADDLSGLSGLLVFDHARAPVGSGGERSAGLGLPVLAALAPCQKPAPKGHWIEFADGDRIPRPLRGAKLMEGSAPTSVETGLAGIEVLATSAGKPVWWCSGSAFFSAFAPAELAEEETLRDHLCVGRFMSLVPMLHFLEQVCKDLRWSEQPLRAAFVIDDPNVHWPSYGHLHYADMVVGAREHGYHVGLAMVPLDGWLVNRRAASLIRDNATALSLLVHGNNHLSRELGRLAGDGDAERVIAQALRRSAAFERRSGLPLDRVMVPPHESCSRAVLRAMFRLGFDAACIARRWPWPDREPLPSPPHWPLAKWHPTDMIGGGIPILPRSLITRSWEDLVFRALLRQPLVLFGHHWDFGEGLDLLAEAASYINRLGNVQWGPLGWVARHCVRTRRDGQTLIVQMHTRRTAVEVPEGVELLEVRAPRAWDDRSGRRLAHAAGSVAMACHSGWWTTGPLKIAPQMRLELQIASDRPIDPAVTPRPGIAPWAMLRRVLVEGRDRAQPFAHKLLR